MSVHEDSATPKRIDISSGATDVEIERGADLSDLDDDFVPFSF